MSVGLKRGTVAVEPHRTEWEVAAHEEVAREYSDLKERLAEAYPEDRIAYTDGKSALIGRILQAAEQWRKQSTRGLTEV